MPAYYKATLQEFVHAPATEIAGTLSRNLIQRFSGNHQEQLLSWERQIAITQAVGQRVIDEFRTAANWGVLIEYPLLRLQRRLDTVTLVGQVVVVVEFKAGARKYEPADARQVEDYALDLRDFHRASHSLTIVPVLCATAAPRAPLPEAGAWGTVWPVHYTNGDTLFEALARVASSPPQELLLQLDLQMWDSSPYTPVPTIIEAAELLYAGHQVQEIAHAAADAHNLASTADRLVEVVRHARDQKRRIVCFVTGVPGSGKTLTGLNLVHDARLKNVGNVPAAYLSGNTPLVEVLREALARDRHRRTAEPKGQTRRIVRTEIQHLMDYLREYVTANPSHVPHEHVIVFDEAQRAWDAAYGKQKFGREASEPALFLEIMGRHREWAVIVALVGGGQEINVGEGGLREWGNALAIVAQNQPDSEWDIYAAPDVILGGGTTVAQTLFDHSYVYPGVLETDKRLNLTVSVRSFQCEAVSTWVDQVLAGHVSEAHKIAIGTEKFPVYLTRSLSVARAWLHERSRGNRHSGFVASSGARRLRADGMGVTLSANDRDAYVHWYLEPKGDIRSSNALEVAANEYTCQGLELDYSGICWGGDMLWEQKNHAWDFRELRGPGWNATRKRQTQEYIRNTYRVLMTRSRLEMVIWVPAGDVTDKTREPRALNETADLLQTAGARGLDVKANSVGPTRALDTVAAKSST